MVIIEEGSCTLPKSKNNTNKFLLRALLKVNKKIIHISALMKFYFAYVSLHIFFRKLLKKEIWLLQEKRTEARDNAYHLFKYLNTEFPEQKDNFYFIITKNSVDLEKVKSIGNVIYCNTLKHYIYYLAAKYNIGSQHFCASPGPGDFIEHHNYLRSKNQKKVFLQHGIILNNVIGLSYKRNKFDLFTCSSEREYNFMKDNFGHPKDVPQLLGLCRYDNLINSSEKQKTVLIMPTFRMYLNPMDPDETPSKKDVEKFVESEFFHSYKKLLSNDKLLACLKEKGYKIIFYLHYSLQAYHFCFKEFENDNVIVAFHKDFDVQDLLIKSSVLVTDFSSIFFDFAYMKKPEIFFQFDVEKFRKSHYAEGYFSYKNDAFGPVYAEGSDVVDYLIDRLENNCEIEQKYLDRIEKYFSFYDSKNCERTYNAIKKL